MISCWRRSTVAAFCLVSFIWPILSSQLPGQMSAANPAPPEKPPGEILVGVHDHPYKADVKATWTLRMSKTQVLTREVDGILMRDSDGNIRVEENSMQSGSSPVKGPRLFSVFNAGSMTQTSWSSNSSTATSLRATRFQSTFFEGLTVPMPFNLARSSLRNCLDKQIQCTTEPLGKKLIGNLQAEGTRYAEVIPADMVGGDHDIAIHSDVWINKEIGAVLLIRVSDPLSGDFTLQVSNLVSGPQDGNLFQIPNGYDEKSITPPPGLLPRPPSWPVPRPPS